MIPISELRSASELRHGLGPIWTSARIANPHFEIGGRVTFPEAASFEIAAPHWRTNVFEPLIRPVFLAVLDHARRGEAREILALDARLTRELSPSAAEGSTREGQRLAAISSDIRGDRTLQKIVAWVAAGDTPGHLATVFAARCVAFSLADRAACGAYLFQELAGGAASTPVPAVCDFISSCLDPLASPNLRAA